MLSQMLFQQLNLLPCDSWPWQTREIETYIIRTLCKRRGGWTHLFCRIGATWPMLEHIYIYTNIAIEKTVFLDVCATSCLPKCYRRVGTNTTTACVNYIHGVLLVNVGSYMTNLVKGSQLGQPQTTPPSWYLRHSVIPKMYVPLCVIFRHAQYTHVQLPHTHTHTLDTHKNGHPSEERPSPGDQGQKGQKVTRRKHPKTVSARLSNFSTSWRFLLTWTDFSYVFIILISNIGRGKNSRYKRGSRIKQ